MKEPHRYNIAVEAELNALALQSNEVSALAYLNTSALGLVSAASLFRPRLIEIEGAYYRHEALSLFQRRDIRGPDQSISESEAAVNQFRLGSLFGSSDFWSDGESVWELCRLVFGLCLRDFLESVYPSKFAVLVDTVDPGYNYYLTFCQRNGGRLPDGTMELSDWAELNFDRVEVLKLGIVI
jgi:hypothetical protein